MKNQSAINILFKASFEFEINYNDVFFPGSYSEKISKFDLYKIMDLIEKYEYDALFAYESLALGIDPFNKRYCTNGFYSSKDEIKKMLENGQLQELKDRIDSNKE
jgi:hypothetical protein